jgi:hypothetical protein
MRVRKYDVTAALGHDHEIDGVMAAMDQVMVV